MKMPARNFKSDFPGNTKLPTTNSPILFIALNPLAGRAECMRIPQNSNIQYHIAIHP